MRPAIIATIAGLIGLCLGPAHAATARVYVMFGQGGALTSLGMLSLASQLEQIPGLKITTHPWEYPYLIAADILRQPKDTPIILIGYSLGASMTTYIASKVQGRKIALAVAYDPSVWAPPLPAGPNIERMICFKNVDPRNVYGRAGIKGSQVETVLFSQDHITVSFNQFLHDDTIAAVRRVVGEP